VLGLEAGVGVFGWWGDNGGGGGAMWKEVVGKTKDVLDGGGGRIWKEGVRNVWCVFALVCLEGVCGGLA
jgi:hypothetical protein